jgi:hypothetical protein
VAEYDGNIMINPEELSVGRFWSFQEIKRELGKGVFTPNFEQEFRTILSSIWRK